MLNNFDHVETWKPILNSSKNSSKVKVLDRHQTAFPAHFYITSCKTLYGLTKTLCNERPKQSTAVLDKDGNILSKESDMKEREHRTLQRSAE